MFSKTITFTNFQGQPRTQEFYFHMSKADLLELAAGGNELMERLQRMIDTKDMRAILAEVRAIVSAAAGTRSPDGELFLKTPEAKSVLMDSPAYDELLMELCSDAGAMADFVNNLLPEKMRDELVQRVQGGKDGSSGQVVELPADDTRPDWLKEGRTPTHQELMRATPEELQAAFRHSGK